MTLILILQSQAQFFLQLFLRHQLFLSTFTSGQRGSCVRKKEPFSTFQILPGGRDRDVQLSRKLQTFSSIKSKNASIYYKKLYKIKIWENFERFNLQNLDFLHQIPKFLLDLPRLPWNRAASFQIPIDLSRASVPYPKAGDFRKQWACSKLTQRGWSPWKCTKQATRRRPMTSYHLLWAKPLAALESLIKIQKENYSRKILWLRIWTVNWNSADSIRNSKQRAWKSWRKISMIRSVVPRKDEAAKADRYTNKSDNAIFIASEDGYERKNYCWNNRA